VARFDTPWRQHVVHLSFWTIAAIAIFVVITAPTNIAEGAAKRGTREFRLPSA